MKSVIDGDSLVYTIGFACQKTIHQAFDIEEGIVFFEHENKDMVLGYIEDNPGSQFELQNRVEVSPESHAFHTIKVIIQKICKRAKANSYKVYITGSGNFRESIATQMGYKHNRIGKPKPVLYQRIREYLMSAHKATLITGMEADDALSIVHTRSQNAEQVNVSLDPAHPVYKYPEETIICAIDKDLRTVPGEHINFDSRVAENDEYLKMTISEEEARRGFWKQVVTGDSSDNILGIPGIGPKKADEIIDGCTTEQEYFDKVYAAYQHCYGNDEFEYFHYTAYKDTTAAYKKRVLKDEAEILPEQRLKGTALTMLLENARLLWMLREPINAEGTHWWMPPYTFEEILARPPLLRAEDCITTEGRGKWFYTAPMHGHPVKVGPFGTKKKAEIAMAAGASPSEKAAKPGRPKETKADEVIAAAQKTSAEVLTGSEHCLSKGAPHEPEDVVAQEILNGSAEAAERDDFERSGEADSLNVGDDVCTQATTPCTLETQDDCAGCANCVPSHWDTSFFA